VNVLVFNPGSSSLKFEVIAAEEPAPHLVRGRKLLSGVIEPIGGPAKLFYFDGRKAVPQEDVPAPDHGRAAELVLSRISSLVDLAACRVVHGGNCYADPVPVDDDVIASIERLDELAPLHNAASASVMRTVRRRLGAAIPSIAVFDTGFHRTIPEHARIYGIPWDLTQRYGIRRYGFHGISHNYMALRYAELTGTPPDQTNIVTLHLEGGSSATAVAGGRSIDTSMGFTPLEGLVMGTRCGDLDPAIVGFLARKEGAPVETVEGWLNKESGLLGISGRSQDTRVLIQYVDEDARARLALDVFAYRVRKYIGAYVAAIGKTAAVVFGGGIGENTPYVRQRVCEGLEGLGLQFAPARNAAVIDREGMISRDGSGLHAFVIPTEEGLMIAHQALLCRCATREAPAST
jgi:acetate kinase